MRHRRCFSVTISVAYQRTAKSYSLPGRIDYTLKLQLASGTSESLSLVFKSVLGGR